MSRVVLLRWPRGAERGCFPPYPVFYGDSFQVEDFESVRSCSQLNKAATKVIWSLGVYVATSFREIKLLCVMECKCDGVLGTAA